MRMEARLSERRAESKSADLATTRPFAWVEKRSIPPPQVSVVSRQDATGEGSTLGARYAPGDELAPPGNHPPVRRATTPMVEGDALLLSFQTGVARGAMRRASMPA
jgi:hypothetical protein